MEPELLKANVLFRTAPAIIRHPGGVSPEKRRTPMETIAGDRRQDRRYDVELKLQYKILKAGRVLDEGNGLTMNMSRGGVQFESERTLTEGMDIELAIEWPFLLRGRFPIQLHVMGSVVRAERNLVSLRTTWHEFLDSANADAGETVSQELAMVM